MRSRGSLETRRNDGRRKCWTARTRATNAAAPRPTHPSSRIRWPSVIGDGDGMLLLGGRAAHAIGGAGPTIKGANLGPSATWYFTSLRNVPKNRTGPAAFDFAVFSLAGEGEGKTRQNG